MGRILLRIGARAAGGDVAPHVPPRRHTSEIQPSVRRSPIGAGRDEDAETADDVAGCEFLDDRLRLEE
jgi:hypothetical protein